MRLLRVLKFCGRLIRSTHSHLRFIWGLILTLDDLDWLSERFTTLRWTHLLLGRVSRAAWARELLWRRLAFSILRSSCGILGVLGRAGAQMEAASRRLVG